MDGGPGHCGHTREGLHSEPLRDIPWLGEAVISVLSREGREYGRTWSRSRCVCQGAFRITHDIKSLLSQTEAVQTSGLVDLATLWCHLRLWLFLSPPSTALVLFYSEKMAVCSTQATRVFVLVSWERERLSSRHGLKLDWGNFREGQVSTAVPCVGGLD